MYVVQIEVNVQLGDPLAIPGTFPSWSPDGTQVIFTDATGYLAVANTLGALLTPPNWLRGSQARWWAPPQLPLPTCTITITNNGAVWAFSNPEEIYLFAERWTYIGNTINVPEAQLSSELLGIIQDLDGYLGSHSAINVESLEIDKLYLFLNTNIVHISKLTNTQGTPTSVDFWTYIGQNVSPCANPNIITFYPSRNEIIPQLANYGIEILEDGQNWTEYELRSILAGVLHTAESFSIMGVQGTNRVERFRHVLLSEGKPELLFARLGKTPTTTEGQYFIDSEGGIGEGNCKSFSGEYLAIVCRGRIENDEINDNNPEVAGEASQYTFVHELGHLFDVRAGEKNPGNLSSRMVVSNETNLGIVISDCNNSKSVVMGYYSIAQKWVRGSRGWGSSGSDRTNNLGTKLNYYSDFQQNPFTKFGGNDVDQSVLVVEVAADMFLNWVYRITTDNVPSDELCDIEKASNQVVGKWFGFRNINPEKADILDASGDAYYESSLPGNARYIWMHTQMNELLSPWRLS